MRKKHSKLQGFIVHWKNHFQVYGSRIHSIIFWDLNSVALHCQRQPCNWFWKWLPLCFGLDPLNNLLCNYTFCKSLCVHLGRLGILCCITVTTRALTKSNLKPLSYQILESSYQEAKKCSTAVCQIPFGNQHNYGNKFGYKRGIKVIFCSRMFACY